MHPLITVEEVQAKLPQLLNDLTQGEVLYITRNGIVIGELTACPPPSHEPRRSGTMKGRIAYMAPDFDASLEFPE